MHTNPFEYILYVQLRTAIFAQIITVCIETHFELCNAVEHRVNKAQADQCSRMMLLFQVSFYFFLFFRHKGFLKDCPNGLLTEQVCFHSIHYYYFFSLTIFETWNVALPGIYQNIQAVFPARWSKQVCFVGFQGFRRKQREYKSFINWTVASECTLICIDLFTGWFDRVRRIH